MFITISRQYGAGGSEVARRVAEALDWTVIDNTFVDQLSERSGFRPEDVASLEERVPSFLERLAQSSALAPDLLMATPEVIDEPDEVKLVKITRALVSELGRRDRLVLVGRAAAAVLARESGALHVRLVASKPYRIQVAIDRLGVDAADAPKLLEETDKNRFRYHKEFYDRDWRDPVNYHMSLNTELLGIDGATSVIVARARELGW